MICATCHGQGSEPPATIAAQDRGRTFYPCQDCGGSGVAHCCKGLREQPVAVQTADGADERRRHPAAAGDRTMIDTMLRAETLWPEPLRTAVHADALCEALEAAGVGFGQGLGARRGKTG